MCSEIDLVLIHFEDATLVERSDVFDDELLDLVHILCDSIILRSLLKDPLFDFILIDSS